MIGRDLIVLPCGDAPLPGRQIFVPAPACQVADANIVSQMAAIINAGRRLILLCGGGCGDAKDAFLSLRERIKAPMVHALRGKDMVESNNPSGVGMTGSIGCASGYRAMVH